MASPRALVTLGVVGTLALAGCRDAAAHRDFGRLFFSDGPESGAGGRAQCAKEVSVGHAWPHAQLAASLERARAERLVLHTYAHAPFLVVPEYVADFDWAAAHGVEMVTYRELAAGYRGPGWAFTVDDDEVDTWYAWRDLLRAHHVKVTFFVTRYDRFTARQKQELRALVADGHDVEAHGKNHENAVDFVAAHGLPAYLRDEVAPNKAALTADGYAPVAFAYPYGAHTAEIDRALRDEFALIRTVGGAWCLKGPPSS